MGVWTRKDYEVAYSRATEYVRKHYPHNWTPGDYYYFVAWGERFVKFK